MLDHLYAMLCLAFLIVLLLGFLAGGFSTFALWFLAICGIALVVTGLGVPLAYWSRTALPSIRILASLPAPARRPRSLPAASDE